MEEVLDDAGMFVQEFRVSLACNRCACTCSQVEKGWQLNWASSLRAENANYKGICRNYMTVVQKGFLQKPTMVNYFIFTGSDFVFVALFHCTLYVLHSSIVLCMYSTLASSDIMHDSLHCERMGKPYQKSNQETSGRK